jgi:UDP-hydrolysing UDP-N-acetyl-D-glucosamine 2-epimerase
LTRKIAVLIGSRANYASLKSVISALKSREDIDLEIVTFASATSTHYGDLAQIMAQDGFPVDTEIESLAHGGTTLSMTRTTGLSLIELGTALRHSMPDIALVVGDRHEVLAAAIAASYQNIPVAHTMGGEITGTIDESVRHAITKLSHLHFPATELAGERISRMGERPESIFVTGCPRIDVARKVSTLGSSSVLQRLSESGVGAQIAFDEPFVLVSQHPVTTEVAEAGQQMANTLEAVKAFGLPAIVLWPNADAGNDDASRAIRHWRETNPEYPAHFYRTLPMEEYLSLMLLSTVMVGNSSSGIREGAFLGVPVVDVGTRQARRERAGNVVQAEPDPNDLLAKMTAQATHGSYETSLLYGDGRSGQRVAEILATILIPNVQKEFRDGSP